jgi:hypothetical protein
MVSFIPSSPIKPEKARKVLLLVYLKEPNPIKSSNLYRSIIQNNNAK